MTLSKLLEILKDREAWHPEAHEVAKVRHNLATEKQQQNNKVEKIMQGKKDKYHMISLISGI